MKNILVKCNRCEKIFSEEKIIKFTAQSSIATKEFVLNIINEKYILTICAYGEWWDEEFNNVDELKKYLITEWNFEDFSFLKEIGA